MDNKSPLPPISCLLANAARRGRGRGHVVAVWTLCLGTLVAGRNICRRAGQIGRSEGARRGDGRTWQRLASGAGGGRQLTIYRQFSELIFEQRTGRLRIAQLNPRAAVGCFSQLAVEQLLQVSHSCLVLLLLLLLLSCDCEQIQVTCVRLICIRRLQIWRLAESIVELAVEFLGQRRQIVHNGRVRLAILILILVVFVFVFVSVAVACGSESTHSVLGTYHLLSLLGQQLRPTTVVVPFDGLHQLLPDNNNVRLVARLVGIRSQLA